MCDAERHLDNALDRIELLKVALKPFADYADKRETTPDTMIISLGSSIAKRQLTMGDCRNAFNAIKTI